MQINAEEFFREATLRICGSLDVETFLYDSFTYVRRFVPADTMYLVHYYRDRGEQLVLASATEKGSVLLNMIAVMPPDVNKLLEHPEIRVMIVDRAETNPIARVWIKKGEMSKDDSLLSLRLFLRGEYVGAMVFIARGSRKFSQEHAALIAPLREPFAIAVSNSLRYKELLELKELLAEDNRFLQSELREVAGEEIIGADFGLRDVMEMVRQVAPLSSPVLLLGETGTGKEVIATAIHNVSLRKDGPFIKVNCGAIPENLVDSELFGHEKGAFTGALSRKRGRFERANGGTIFLDEVGELQPEVQVRLLRVLQEKEIERVGGTEPVKVDIRVIAATNRDVKSMLKDGTFREDLYFRLNVFPITIPPLRDRKDDIASLVYHFMHKKSREIGRKNVPPLDSGALGRLMAYSWPGNVRELENSVERALILNRDVPLAFDETRASIAPKTRVEPEADAAQMDIQGEERLALDEVVSGHIRRVLDMTGGKVGGEGGAADLLQMNPSTLRKKMRKLGIPFGRKTTSK
ncbi:MAG: sigma-54-dependent Fis family transcriptional regulator [bacterium]|nr:sigma-54-dependent Fis family transcriptional regulator [bacterium]